MLEEYAEELVAIDRAECVEHLVYAIPENEDDRGIHMIISARGLHRVVDELCAAAAYWPESGEPTTGAPEG